MVAPEVDGGSAATVRTVKNAMGATFPFLLNANSNTGGNFITLYAGRDNYIVVNKQHIVRYNSALTYPYGDGFHLDEILGCIDSLVSAPVAVDDARPRDYRIGNLPNPFHHATTFELANPTARDLPARAAIYDIAGREVASLWNAPLAPGVTRVSWNARSTSGATLPAGVYLVRGTIGAVRLARRVVVLP